MKTVFNLKYTPAQGTSEKRETKYPCNFLGELLKL